MVSSSEKKGPSRRSRRKSERAADRRGSSPPVFDADAFLGDLKNAEKGGWTLFARYINSIKNRDGFQRLLGTNNVGNDVIFGHLAEQGESAILVRNVLKFENLGTESLNTLLGMSSGVRSAQSAIDDGKVFDRAKILTDIGNKSGHVTGERMKSAFPVFDAGGTGGAYDYVKAVKDLRYIGVLTEGVSVRFEFDVFYSVLETGNLSWIKKNRELLFDIDAVKGGIEDSLTKSIDDVFPKFKGRHGDLLVSLVGAGFGDEAIEMIGKVDNESLDKDVLEVLMHVDDSLPVIVEHPGSFGLGGGVGFSKGVLDIAVKSEIGINADVISDLIDIADSADRGDAFAMTLIEYGFVADVADYLRNISDLSSNTVGTLLSKGYLSRLVELGDRLLVLPRQEKTIGLVYTQAVLDVDAVQKGLRQKIDGALIGGNIGVSEFDIKKFFESEGLRLDDDAVLIVQDYIQMRDVVDRQMQGQVDTLKEMIQGGGDKGAIDRAAESVMRFEKLLVEEQVRLAENLQEQRGFWGKTVDKVVRGWEWLGEKNLTFGGRAPTRGFLKKVGYGAKRFLSLRTGAMLALSLPLTFGLGGTGAGLLFGTRMGLRSLSAFGSGSSLAQKMFERNLKKKASRDRLEEMSFEDVVGVKKEFEALPGGGEGQEYNEVVAVYKEKMIEALKDDLHNERVVMRRHAGERDAYETVNKRKKWVLGLGVASSVVAASAPEIIRSTVVAASAPETIRSTVSEWVDGFGDNLRARRYFSEVSGSDAGESVGRVADAERARTLLKRGVLRLEKPLGVSKVRDVLNLEDAVQFVGEGGTPLPEDAEIDGHSLLELVKKEDGKQQISVTPAFAEEVSAASGGGGGGGDIATVARSSNVDAKGDVLAVERIGEALVQGSGDTSVTEQASEPAPQEKEQKESSSGVEKEEETEEEKGELSGNRQVGKNATAATTTAAPGGANPDQSQPETPAAKAAVEESPDSGQAEKGGKDESQGDKQEGEDGDTPPTTTDQGSATSEQGQSETPLTNATEEESPDSDSAVSAENNQGVVLAEGEKETLVSGADAGSSGMEQMPSELSGKVDKYYSADELFSEFPGSEIEIKFRFFGTDAPPVPSSFVQDICIPSSHLSRFGGHLVYDGEAWFDISRDIRNDHDFTIPTNNLFQSSAVVKHLELASSPSKRKEVIINTLQVLFGSRDFVGRGEVVEALADELNKGEKSKVIKRLKDLFSDVNKGPRGGSFSGIGFGPDESANIESTHRFFFIRGVESVSVGFQSRDGFSGYNSQSDRSWKDIVRREVDAPYRNPIPGL